MGTLWQELRYGVRMLRGSPAVTALVVGILAVAIGANTAVFSVINTVLLRPLPFPRADRLAKLEAIESSRETTGGAVSWLDFRDWQEQSECFSSTAAFVLGGSIVLAPAGAELFRAAGVTPAFFEVLGVRPMLGRTPGSRDAGPLWC